MKLSAIKIKPHHLFLLAASILGLFYQVVNPPLQVPDEHDHFKRAYHISEGHFLPEKRGQRLGGEIPLSFKEYFVPYRNAATNLKYTLTGHTSRPSFKTPVNPEEKEFDDFPNTSYYSPVSYIPQALAISVFKSLNTSTAVMFYGGRLFVFLFWLTSMYFLIKTIPVAKWLFTVLLLLPMSLFVSCSYSADVVTNVISFWFIALVIKFSVRDKLLGGSSLALLAGLTVLLALSKLVYVGLVFSVFIIPASKFSNRKLYWIFNLLLLFAGFAIALAWAKAAMKFYTPYSDYDPYYKHFCCLSPCGNYYEQKNYILNNGLYIFKVLLKTIFKHPHSYLHSYIGAFGYLDIRLPWLLWILAYPIILLVAAGEKNAFTLSLKQKMILAFSAFAAFVLLVLSQHLTWDCVGEGIVDTIQGRYLIPIFPLIFLLFMNRIEKFKKAFSPLLILYVIFLSGFLMVVTYQRYYVDSYIEKTEYSCDAERVNENNYFLTSNPGVTLEGGFARDSSVSRSGKYSVLMSDKMPYAFTYHFRGLKQGDLIEISAWQKGSGAQLVVGGKGRNCGEFFYNYPEVRYRSKDGWSRLESVFTMTKDCTEADSTEVKFFIWYPANGSTYVDDVSFSIKKFSGYYFPD